MINLSNFLKHKHWSYDNNAAQTDQHTGNFLKHYKCFIRPKIVLLTKFKKSMFCRLDYLIEKGSRVGSSEV